MKTKSIIFIVLIILVSLLALSNALHVYEEGNISLEEQDHDHIDNGNIEEHHENNNNTPVEKQDHVEDITPKLEDENAQE